MSLRMNLYGWNHAAFVQTIGGKDERLLEKATTRACESLREEAKQAQAKAWLTTLIMDGHPFRKDRKPPAQRGDGGLVPMYMESQTHALAIHFLIRALDPGDYLDLALDSSTWAHPSTSAPYNDLSACKFLESRSSNPKFLFFLSKLSQGSPLFGDDFITDWSYYTWASNQELAAMIPILQAATEYKRKLPEGYPDEFLQKLAVEPSEGAKRFLADLIKWFGQIEQAGQDAFIFWS